MIIGIRSLPWGEAVVSGGHVKWVEFCSDGQVNFSDVVEVEGVVVEELKEGQVNVLLAKINSCLSCNLT